MGGMEYPPNRRSFLIAGGLTALASTRVLGANDTLRVGVLGAGGRMGDLLNAADKVGGYQIVAVSDVYGPRRDAVKLRSNGVATTHVDYREVLQKEIDAVIIASPDHWHVRMAVDALAAGKDVYLEKPVTHTLEEGATLTHAVRSGKRILQCGMQLSRCGGADSGREPGARAAGENLLVAKLFGWRGVKANRYPGARLEAVAGRGTGAGI
jgi:Oxidoreductase family, NAD-binding Rossmann fold